MRPGGAGRSDSVPTAASTVGSRRSDTPIWMAATTEETFPRVGSMGLPIFVGLRGMDTGDLRVHLQTYMFELDPVARRVARALADAGVRGVQGRVLVDSLLSLHGSLAAENPLLGKLGRSAGVEVRVVRPVEGLPGVKGVAGPARQP